MSQVKLKAAELLCFHLFTQLKRSGAPARFANGRSSLFFLTELQQAIALSCPEALVPLSKQ